VRTSDVTLMPVGFDLVFGRGVSVPIIPLLAIWCILLYDIIVHSGMENVKLLACTAPLHVLIFLCSLLTYLYAELVLLLTFQEAGRA
jgi:hypothetical protein